MRLNRLCAVLGVSLCLASAFSQTPRMQLIRNVRVFDGQDLRERRSVLLDNGRISRIGGPALTEPNAEIIDGSGRTLLPGLIDAHVHMPDDVEGAAHQALLLGVTTQLDMSTIGDQRLKAVKKIEIEDRPSLADLRTAGSPATVPGGHPSQMGGPPFPTLTGPDQAEAFVNARIAEGADYIKIIHDDGSTWPWTHARVPMLDNPTMRALVAAAHKRGKLAVVHVLSEQQARDAIESGADGLAHLFLGDRCRRLRQSCGKSSRIRRPDPLHSLPQLRQVAGSCHSCRCASRPVHQQGMDRVHEHAQARSFGKSLVSGSR